MSENYIVLYPSNWLYNAGVIGLLKVLEAMGEPVKEFLNDDGSITFSITKKSDEIFKKWDSLSPKSKKDKDTSLVYGWKGAYYSNQNKDSIKKRIDFLIKGYESKRGVEFLCSFCTNKVRVKKTDAIFLNQAFGIILLASEKTFCNMYWNNSSKDFICPRCQFVLMCHHLALTRLSDGSEIFINAPSFEVMWYLNKFVRKIFGSTSSEERQNKRNILAMSVIEYATKIQAILGIWTRMNIEVVSKQGSQIEFFSLPYEVIQLLSDRRIASILSQIGEFEILNRVLDLDFSRLMEMGYRLLRIGLKPDKRAESEDKFINQTLWLDKNRQNPIRVAEQIFKLRALIEEKRKRREYEHISFARS